MPTNPARPSMMVPWMVATVLPPNTLPTIRALRRTGATIISRKKPNSRSHTMETAEKMEVKSTTMASTPGNMKVRKSMLPPAEGAIGANPVPQHKEEQDGLSESRDHTGAVAGKADKLPPPHNTHGSKVIPQTTSGFAGGENLGLFWGRVWRSGLVHHYLLMCRRMKGLLRARSVLDDSASRIVWPV